VTGATLYSTLEPCAHYGRTPPCTDAIVAAGVGRVVIGLLDPDPLVSGRGVAALEAAGIEVVTGVLADEVTEQLAAYLKHRRTDAPSWSSSWPARSTAHRRADGSSAGSPRAPPATMPPSAGPLRRGRGRGGNRARG